MPTLALHESCTALQELQAVQHIFLASDLHLPSKSCLHIGSHVL